MMSSYRGMTRGFCKVSGGAGVGLGRAGLLSRFKPEPGKASSLRDWLLDNMLPRLASTRGLGSAHLFEGALTPRMTNEQRMRGADAGVDWALLVTGYDEAVVERLVDADLGRDRLAEHGVSSLSAATYTLQYLLTKRELNA